VLLLVGCGGASEAPRPPSSLVAASEGAPVEEVPECDERAPDVVRMSSTHRCVRRPDGSAYCARHDDSLQPVHVEAGVAQVAVSDGYFCFRMVDGTVRCAATPDRRLGPHALDDLWDEVEGVARAVDVSAARDHACAVVQGGGVRCWGSNEYGELGDGSTEPRSGAVAVRSVAGAVDVEVGDFACALLEDGTVSCWGTNMTPTASDVGLTGVAGISIGGLTGCAWTESGDVWCWGANESGQAGVEPYPEYDEDQFLAEDPRFDQLHEPRRAFGGAQQVALGDRFGCGRFDGEVRCWGAEWSHPRSSEEGLRRTRNRSGRGGSAAQWRYSATPMAVVGLCDATALHAGGRRWCAVRGSGEVACSDGEGLVTRTTSCRGRVSVSIAGGPVRPDDPCR